MYSFLIGKIIFVCVFFFRIYFMFYIHILRLVFIFFSNLYLLILKVCVFFTTYSIFYSLHIRPVGLLAVLNFLEALLFDDFLWPRRIRNVQQGDWRAREGHREREPTHTSSHARKNTWAPIDTHTSARHTDRAATTSGGITYTPRGCRHRISSTASTASSSAVFLLFVVIVGQENAKMYDKRKRLFTLFIIAVMAKNYKYVIIKIQKKQRGKIKRTLIFMEIVKF